jgi:hypothetical protein
MERVTLFKVNRIIALVFHSALFVLLMSRRTGID